MRHTGTHNHVAGWQWGVGITGTQNLTSIEQILYYVASGYHAEHRDTERNTLQPMPLRTPCLLKCFSDF